MSDGKEVKPQYLWFCQKSGWQVTSFDPNEDEAIGFSGRKDTRLFINKETHDRIMAERDELWKRATKFVMPGEMDTGESIEHYIKTLEQTIAELRAEVERLKRANQIVPRDAELLALNGKFRDTIARQAKVIEKLKGMVSHYETCAMADSYDDEIVSCDCGLDKELAAIEQGEG